MFKTSGGRFAKSQQKIQCEINWFKPNLNFTNSPNFQVLLFGSEAVMVEICFDQFYL